MQLVPIVRGGRVVTLQLPTSSSEVLPGIPWGRADQILSPAYWAIRCQTDDNPMHGFLSQNQTLRQEVGFCILGGFGVTAEMNHVFFDALNSIGAFDEFPDHSEHDLLNSLNTPRDVNGTLSRYRFPKQRAKRIFDAMQQLNTIDVDSSNSRDLRDALQAISGIGPKTASWIARNWLGADDLAIIDIHVARACQLVGLFPKRIKLPAEYHLLEDSFLAFSAGLGVQASILDAVMWTDMRTIPPTLRAH